MDDNVNGKPPQWKTTSKNYNPIRMTTSNEDDLNGRQLQWKTSAMEEDLNGILPCLASQCCTELGPAQPQLVKLDSEILSLIHRLRAATYKIKKMVNKLGLSWAKLSTNLAS